MIIESFNRRSVIAKHVRARNAAAVATKDSLEGGIKWNANLDPGFEGFGESRDVHVGSGLVAHFDSTVEDDDPILESAVALGQYYQMPLMEQRAHQ